VACAGFPQWRPKAKQKLRKRHKELLGGTYIGQDEERLTVSDLLDALAAHLKTKAATRLPPERQTVRRLPQAMGERVQESRL
jgi:hypothetical protein